MGVHCTNAHTYTHELMYTRPLLGSICTGALHKACGRLPHKNTCSRTRAILVPCTGTVRSTGSLTHVAPNVALFHAHMLGTFPKHMPVFTRVAQGPYTPISTCTNYAHVPRHALNAVDRHVPVCHGSAQARAVSDRVGDLCRHERRLQPVPVQASNAGSTGDVTSPGPSHRPRDSRPAPSPQRGVEGRIRPQRQNSGGP